MYEQSPQERAISPACVKKSGGTDEKIPNDLKSLGNRNAKKPPIGFYTSRFIPPPHVPSRGAGSSDYILNILAILDTCAGKRL